MKIYIDELRLKEVLSVIWGLPKSLFFVIKEELFWWIVLYPFEKYGPSDEDKFREGCLRKSRKRMRKQQFR